MRILNTKVLTNVDLELCENNSREPLQGEKINPNHFILVHYRVPTIL